METLNSEVNLELANFFKNLLLNPAFRKTGVTDVPEGSAVVGNAKVRMGESTKEGCSKTETLAMKMLVSIPERDGAVG